MVLLLLALLALALGLLVYQDSGTVTLTFGIWTWHVPLWYPVVAAAVAMLLISFVWMLGARRRWRTDERVLGSARHDAVIANHAALLSDHEAEIAGLHREMERLTDELSRRRDLLA